MEELNVQENQLRIVTHRDVLVKNNINQYIFSFKIYCICLTGKIIIRITILVKLEAYEYIQLLEVGQIGEFVVKPVELELKQELVQIQHQQMEELNVQENHLRIATHKDVLVKTLLK